MKLLKKIVDRVGLTILKPRESFDLLVVEGVPLREGVSVTIFGLLMLSLSSTLLSSFQSSYSLVKNFVFSFTSAFIIWVIFVVSLGSVVKVLYKVPGSLSDYFSGLSYALSTSILPAIVAILLYVLEPTLSIFAIFVALIFGVIWFVWLLILVYMFTESFFKIDFAQFFAALIISLLAAGVVLAIFSIVIASLVFMWWVF